MDSGILPPTGRNIQYRIAGSELMPSTQDGSLAIASGWVGLTADYNGCGRIVGLLLPGDRIGHAMGRMKAVALTPVALIADAQALPSAIPELEHLLRQCLRLQLAGIDRVRDFLMETYERLSSAGLASDCTFEMPITNQQLSEILGMTPVHLSRILTDLRSRRRIRTQGRRIWMAQLAKTDFQASDPGPAPDVTATPMLRRGDTAEYQAASR